MNVTAVPEKQTLYDSFTADNTSKKDQSSFFNWIFMLAVEYTSYSLPSFLSCTVSTLDESCSDQLSHDPRSVLKAEASEEREVVRRVMLIGQAANFLQVRHADQWQPAQQLEAPDTRKWRRGDQFFKRGRQRESVEWQEERRENEK